MMSINLLVLQKKFGVKPVFIFALQCGMNEFIASLHYIKKESLIFFPPVSLH